jgi:predicted dehydrogenase/predicted ester cyclase
MSVEQNKETVRRWFTEIVRGGVDRATFQKVADQVFAPDFLDHDGPDPEHSKQALVRTVPALLQALPDARFSVELLLGEGEYVAVRVHGEATHTGEAMGRTMPSRRSASGSQPPAERAMNAHRTGLGIVGAGVISAEYVRTLHSAADVQVRFLAARDPGRARVRAEELGVPAAGTYAELLSDPSIEVVVNLTVPQAHAEVTEQALESGRHVYSEKPLALSRSDGRRLLDLAAERRLRLGCAPDTLLGAGMQTALRLVRSGGVGNPRSGFANFQYGGPNLWHPNPEFLFREGGGPLLDVGPYYLTALIQVFGPVARVSALAVQGASTRVIGRGPRAGESFPVDVPTHVMALYEFAEGGVADVVLSFDSPIRRIALEVNGSDGALRLPDPNMFTGDSEVFGADGTSRTVAAVGPGGPARGSGVVDLVRSLRGGVPERASGALAYHVLDVMVATDEAGRTGQPVSVSGRVDRAPLLPAGWSLTSPAD